MANLFAKQIENRNFLSPGGFKFTITRKPKLSFLSNSATVPGITLGTAVQPTYLRDLDVPGDKIQFEDFSMSFLVDETMENYMEIHNWIIGLGYPESVQQFKDLLNDEERNLNNIKNQFSDGTLQILNSNYQVQAQVNFKDLFPVSLSALEFIADDSDTNYFTATATFKYTYYVIADRNGRTRL